MGKFCIFLLCVNWSANKTSRSERISGQWQPACNTSWHIDVHYVKFSCIYCEVKHNGIWGWDIYFLDGWGIYGLIGCAIYYLKGWGIYGLIGCTIYDLNGWGIYGSNGWDSYGKVSYSFGRNAENTGLQGSTRSSHAGH